LIVSDVFNLSQNYEIDLIVAEYMYDAMDGDALIELLPLAYQDADQVVWEQPENGYGLLSLRGLNGEPDVAPVTGFRRYAMSPGYYGERVVIDETEMTKARQPGTPNEAVDHEWLIGWRMQQETVKAFNQVRNIIAALLLTGKFLNRKPNGAVTHADSIAGFNSLSPATGWAASPSTATPIDDLLGWKNALQTGTSSRFGKGSKLLMQTGTLNDLFATAQIRTLFKIEYGNTPLGLDGVNAILAGFELPQIEVYDEGYYPDVASAAARTNFVRFLPAKSIIWAGVRPKGQTLGQFYFTRNLINRPPVGEVMDSREQAADLERMPWAEGIYTLLEYHRMPPKYVVDIGFNGGPAIRYPSAVAGITYS
jgi:hypothetical protein